MWKGLIGKGMTNHQLKLLAVIFMTCDHAGKVLFPDWLILQIIGRLAFPMFAFMIAEGCIHTGNRKKYLISMGGLALFCQLFYFLAMDSLYQSVLVTFTLSILWIYTLEDCRVQILRLENTEEAGSPSPAIPAPGFRNSGTKLLRIARLAAGPAATGCGIWVVCRWLPRWLSDTDFAIDYGWYGAALPVVIAIIKNRAGKLVAAALLLILLALEYQGIQWYSLLALPLLSLYNGNRGRYGWKYFFYLYYPLHLAVIYLISLL